MLTPSIAAAISADYASLISLFARKLGNLAQAEDLVSAAFLESLEKLAKQQIADTTRFSGFVYGVAFNLLRNHKRRIDNRADTRVADFVLDSLPSESASPDEQLSKLTLSNALREMIQQLPAARDRELVVRFYLCEETKEQICQEMGLGSLHFDKVLFRARGRLRRIVERSGIYSGPERRVRREGHPAARPASVQ
jgi:RNA polymerase sigma-70 factor, ECF subfamily